MNGSYKSLNEKVIVSPMEVHMEYKSKISKKISYVVEIVVVLNFFFFKNYGGLALILGEILLIFQYNY